MHAARENMSERVRKGTVKLAECEAQTTETVLHSETEVCIHPCYLACTLILAILLLSCVVASSICDPSAPLVRSSGLAPFNRTALCLNARLFSFSSCFCCFFRAPRRSPPESSRARWWSRRSAASLRSNSLAVCDAVNTFCSFFSFE